MPLTAGDKLGPYEILEPIGAGGMGEVYRARDPRLNRDVAIKVSAAQFSERFEREAKAIAALNHPNICHLYDVGPNYLVMELIDGPTLAERLKQEPILLEESLNLARQIAEALEAAHEKGITHRDLKPGNIKIKPDGTLKVLDFGLAKIGATAVLSDNSPTLTIGQTEAGMILGTAAYMSPEQAKGKPVDQRSDIYAFGLVLYEMVTGKRLHNGESTTEVLASVIKEGPRLENAPPQVRRMLKRCLEKDPQKRLRHIGDVMALVDDAPTIAPVPVRRPNSDWMWPTVAGASMLVALTAVGWIFLHAPHPTDLPLVRLDADLGQEISLPAPVPYVSNVIISPDGTRLAYMAAVGTGEAKIFTRKLDQSKATELTGTEGARGPFFSPDGNWLGFFASGKLYKISVDGGAAVPLVGLASFAGASWGEDFIVVAEGISKPLARIGLGGGAETPVAELASGELIQTSPQILPGGKVVLFSANKSVGPDTATVEVITLADHRRKMLVAGGAFPRYVPSVAKGPSGYGHLLYTFKGALYAIPFDPDKLETRGTAVPLLDDVSVGTANVAGKFDVSQTGTLVYQKGSTGGAVAMSTIQWLDSTGRQQPLQAKPGAYAQPRLSPDGKRISFVVSEGGNLDIQSYDWQGDRTTKLTFGGVHQDPVWSPDGQYVVFVSLNPLGIDWTRADGSGQPQPLIKQDAIPWSFSPDGKRLAYVDASGANQIWTVTVEQQNGQLKASAPEQFLKDQFRDEDPAFSPDGKWLAYSSTESGSRAEVYVRPFPAPASGQGGKWVVSTQGGQFPVWSRASHDLLYLAPNGQIMAASYTIKGDIFAVDKARVWLAAYAGSGFDLAPDGKRIAAVIPVRSAGAPKLEHEIAFIENFFDELRRKAPVGK